MGVFVVAIDDLRIYFTIRNFVHQGRNADFDLTGGGL